MIKDIVLWRLLWTR